jgi:hypothetical protein
MMTTLIPHARQCPRHLEAKETTADDDSTLRTRGHVPQGLGIGERPQRVDSSEITSRNRKTARRCSRCNQQCAVM